jgi:hypothetical protein
MALTGRPLPFTKQDYGYDILTFDAMWFGSYSAMFWMYFLPLSSGFEEEMATAE